MEIIVKNKNELKEIVSRTTDGTAFIIEFEEVQEDEARRSEDTGA